MSAEQIAQAFHESYERLAPEHGYETREASAKPWEEVPEQNKGLMVAVVGDLLERGAVRDPDEVDAMRTIVAALAIYGEEANLGALVEKARALNEASPATLNPPVATEPAGHTVEVYKDAGGDYRWRRKAANGEVVADSGEGYVHAADARRMAGTLNQGAEVVDLTREPETGPDSGHTTTEVES